jgi:hypothetical protein
VQAHFARLCRAAGVHLFAGSSGSARRSWVLNRLWALGLLATPAAAHAGLSIEPNLFPPIAA